MEPATLSTQPVTEPSEDVLDLRQILRTLRRRWILAVSAPLFTIVVTIGYLRATPRIYEAVSIVRAQQSSPPLLALPFPNQQRSPQQIDLKTVERLVTTRLTIQESLRLLKGKDKAVLEQLLARGSSSSLAFAFIQQQTSPQSQSQDRALTDVPDVLVEKVLKMVRTKVIEPDLVEIRIRHSDPKVAALVANSLAEAMVHRFTAESQREASQERRYIETSLKTLEQQLQDLEAQIAKEKQRLGIVDIPKEMETLLTALHTYELELHNAQAQRDAAAEAVARLQQQLAKEQPIVSVDVLKDDPILKQMRDQLAQLEVERARLLATFTIEHPEVQQVEERIAALREALTKHARQLVKEREVAPNPAYQLLFQQLITAETNRFSAEARLEALNRFLPTLRQRLTALPENQRRLSALMRKAQAAEQVYTNLLMRLEEVRIREATRVGNLTIADVATPPHDPVSPRPLVSLALALFLGLLLGIVGALLVEGLNETITDPEEVTERLGIPVLAQVPRTRPDLTHEHLLDLMASRRSAAEAIRTLRANLKFLSRQRPMRSLLITSTAPEDGKTFIATALAIAWAQAGHRTVLIDFDLRRPQVHECLGLPNEKGLTNLLVGTADLKDVLQPTALRNLQVITSGPLPPNPAELLDSEQIGRLLESLKEQAEIVILDTPPILAVSDTALLAPLADAVLAVFVPGTTLRPMVQQLKDQVTLAQGFLIGAVLNKVTPSRGGYYYRYYHRYYGEPD